MKSISLKNRFYGCLFGGAVGDALGAQVEFLPINIIKKKFGSKGIQDYAPEYGRLGAITDDTQMTLFTAEGLIQAFLNNSAEPKTFVYDAYFRWLKTQNSFSDSDRFKSACGGWLMDIPELCFRRAPGHSCMTGMQNTWMGTMDKPPNDSKGCGGIMRIAPVGLTNYKHFQTGCEIAALTHGNPTGFLASGFMALLINLILKGNGLPKAIELSTEELVKWQDHAECLQAVESAVKLAKRSKGSPQNVEKLGAGWIAEEALAISLFCSLTAEDFRSGVIAAVNHTGDSDSTGAITGNILGTLLGYPAIPAEWINKLELNNVIGKIAHDFYMCFAENNTAEIDKGKYLD